DLTPWAERGVLLLNRVLTVQPGKPGSHRGKGWEEVTDQAIRALAARKPAAAGGQVGPAAAGGQVSTAAAGQGVDSRYARYRRTAALADR
ncbi:MAG TPA: hypothetical protein VJ370_02435, partial [Streptosporangiaceae bacterium]|nr:hypothetical protein [Streptosporangiaceae bacterium]